jgi:hypothetical protein
MSSGIVEPSQPGNEQPQQQNQPISRTRLVQKLLAATASLPNFIHDLVYTQATLVAGTEAAAFLIEPAQEGGKGFNLKPAAHIRPDESDAETRAAALAAFQEIMAPCVQQGKDGAIQIDGSADGGESQFCLVTLLRNEGNIVAASAVITRARDLDRAQKLLTPMQLVAGYFELFALRRTAEQHKSIAMSHQHVLQLATAVATADGFESASMNLCNELASRTGAARVALGWVKQDKIKLTALSHTEEFDKKQELSVQIVKVMEECLDNDEIVQYEPDGTSTNTVTREASILSRTQGGEAVLSLPLRRQGEVVGVVTLEFAPNQKIGPQAAQGLAVAVELLAPQLYDRFQNDRWLITKAGLSVQNVAKKAIGPTHTLAKTIIAAVIITLLVICNWVPFVDLRPMYHVSAPFTFVSMEKRAISAPFDGELGTVETNPRTGKPFAPGDVVKKDEVIARFKTYDKEQELAVQLARKAAAIAQRDSYGVKPEKAADRKIAQAQADEADEQIKLIQSQINRANIVSDIDGWITKGDLRDKRNSVYRQGDALLELSDINSLEAELHVAERDIQDVNIDSKGKLATHTQPNQKVDFTVRRIVPQGEVKENDNTFNVYATVLKLDPNWKPGQYGEAKVDVEKRTLAWIWVHRTVEWIHFKWWTMW